MTVDATMSTEYPVQFVINDGQPTDTIYLSECTCKELIDAANKELKSKQLTCDTFIIKDNDGIEYHSDDEELDDAFASRDDDESPLCLKIGTLYVYNVRIMHHKSIDTTT